MSDIDAARDRIVTTIRRNGDLTPTDEAAIRALAVEVRELPATAYMVREGQKPRQCALLLNGFMYRQKLTPDGHRAILSLQVPGDFVDLQNLFLEESDHDLVALTPATVVEIASADLRALMSARPAINEAMWTIALVEASRLREWLLNVGRRDATARVAHLLCEIFVRFEAVGLARELTYELPMTQEQLGDALGLTSVHINRVLKELERQGLIRRRKREVTILDWQTLSRAADFNERYLHLGVHLGERRGAVSSSRGNLHQLS